MTRTGAILVLWLSGVAPMVLFGMTSVAVRAVVDPEIWQTDIATQQGIHRLPRADRDKIRSRLIPRIDP